MNITSSLLEDPSSSDDYLLEQVTRWNIDPGHVAIEVVESGIQSLSVLRRFVERYRAYGFLIALDDFGASHSNLERLVELKPDIVKIDRHLVSEVHASHYKRSVVEAINGLCHSLGAISLAEGVEESQELECLSSLGCDLFQGYLLSHPLEDYDSSLTEVRKRVLWHASQTALRIADSARGVHDEITRIVETGRHLGRELQRLSRIDEQLSGLIRRLPDIQCAYVTDLHGMQITETVFNPSTGTREGVLFRPARRGADHSLKDYVYHIRSLGAPHFLTGAYLSRATGTLCRTVSVKTYTKEQTPVILCIDIVQA
ncbi:MAG: EAL domain-containing protein [Spirochaetaceae bacterium]|nr:MAG: EAL domain-containing protein [Spirochaetaceae bacterium]